MIFLIIAQHWPEQTQQPAAHGDEAECSQQRQQDQTKHADVYGGSRGIHETEQIARLHE